MLRRYVNYTATMTDEELEALVRELAADGIVMTKDEARRAVYRLTEILALISEPLPLPPPSSHRVKRSPEVPDPERDEPLPPHCEPM